MLFSILLQLVYSSLHGSCSVFAFGVLRFFCFVLHTMTGFFWFFWFEIFKLFPVKTQFFRRPLIFVRSDCNLRGFEIAPADGSPASVIGHVMTTRDYINVSRSGFHFLVLVLQISNSFNLNNFFSILLQLISSWLQGSCSVFALGVLCFFFLFSLRWLDFLVFFALKFSNCSQLNLIFSEGP